MEIGVLCGVLQACTSELPDTRKAAEATLAQYEHQPGQLTNLLRVGVEDSVDLTIRQAAAITFKNLVKRDWEGKEGASPLSQEDKQAVRDNIIEGIVRAPNMVRLQLGECLKCIVYSDFPEKWPSLLQTVHQNISSQEHARLYGALYALRILAHKYEFKDEEERAPMNEMVTMTFPLLLQVFQALLSLESAAVEVANLLKLVCKIFWSVTYMGIPPPLLQSEQFMGWMGGIHRLLLQPVPTEGQPEDLDQRKVWPWWKCKKWVLHIAFRLFNRYGDPKLTKGETDRAFSELFVKEALLKFLEAHLQLIGQLTQGQYLSPRVINLLLQYISHAVGLSATWRVLKPHAASLMLRVVFPLLCHNDEDEQLWQEDPQEYIRKGYDIIEDMYNPKTAAMNLVHEMCKLRSKAVLQPLMGHVAAQLQAYATAPPPAPPQDVARAMDGTLLAIGALEDVLKAKEPYKSQLETMVKTFVLPLFVSPYGHLRAKACWLAGLYCGTHFSDGCGKGATFTALFHRTIERLQDPDLPVRVDAVVALRSLIDSYDEESLAEMKPLLPGLLTEFFKLMGEVESEDLVFTLETVVEKFGEEMAPYAVGLTQHLTAAFWRIQAGDGGEGDEDDDVGALAAYGCLRALATVLESVSSLGSLFPQLEEILFPVMQRMCGPDGQDVFEEVLELISYFTYFSPQISPRMWSLWPLLFAAFNEWASDYFENILVPLDNYISRDTPTFLSGNYLQQANQMVEKVLTNPDTSEGDFDAAPKLLEAVLQNCRGAVDGCVGPYLALASARLADTPRPAARTLLLNVVANAFYYNAQLAMAQLVAQNTVEALFQAWATAIFAAKKNGSPRHFRRESDKKVQVLGLAALLLLPDEALPASVAGGLGHLFAGALRLLVALKEQKEAESEGEGEGEEEEEEDDGDDDGDDISLGEGSGDGELSDEEGRAADSAYMRRLEREARRLKGGLAEDDADADDEWSDSEDENVTTPLDPIDPFIFFADTLATIQASAPARWAAMSSQVDPAAAQALTGMMQFAAELRMAPPAAPGTPGQ